MKKSIVIIVIFLICAVVSTYYLIDYTNKKNANISNSNEIVNDNIQDNNVIAIVPDNLGIKSITEKYDENPIKFVSNGLGYDGLSATNYYSDNGTEKYIDNFNFSMEGLKNKEIQNKINTSIKSEIEYVKSNSSDEEIRVDIVGNFANILSLKISSIDIAPLSAGSVIRYLTLDLSTGEKLNFNDLFTNTSDIKGMLTSGIYNGIMSKSRISKYNESNGNFSVIYAYEISQDIYTKWEDNYYKTNSKIDDVEAETIRILKNVKNAEELNFCVSPKFITIFINNTFIPINMIVYKENIAIYNRFKANNNIYDGTVENIKDLYIFSSGIIDRNYYVVNDNLVVRRNE